MIGWVGLACIWARPLVIGMACEDTIHKIVGCARFMGHTGIIKKLEKHKIYIILLIDPSKHSSWLVKGPSRHYLVVLGCVAGLNGSVLLIAMSRDKRMNYHFPLCYFIKMVEGTKLLTYSFFWKNGLNFHGKHV